MGKVDIISLPIEFDKDKIDGDYRLVSAAVIRAKDLAQGVQPNIDSLSRKVTSIAIEEIVTDSVDMLTGDAALKAREKAKKLFQKRAVEESKDIEKLPEDLTELEKDLKVYLTEKGERDSKKVIEEIFGENKNSE